MYWRIIDGGRPPLHFKGHNSLERMETHLPAWCEAARTLNPADPTGTRIAIFATFRYWIEHAALLGLSLNNYGHSVTLLYMPYAKYDIPESRFDLLRQDAYVEQALRAAGGFLEIESLYKVPPDGVEIPAELHQPIEEISMRDTQYSQRVEEFDREKDQLYQMRMERNQFAARVALKRLQADRPDVLIVPNGSILEYGILYHVGRYLEIPVVTYEFDEPQYRIRIAQDAEVMREDTREFWEARKADALTEAQYNRVSELIRARQGGSLYENYPLQFQGTPKEGEAQVREKLGLDERPLVLLAPNIFGDSATLGRQVFTESMSEWLRKTVAFFTERPGLQLVIRIHPSEARFDYGTSMAEVLEEAFPRLPDHIHVIPADAKVNTYDLAEICDLGIVYTTTIGLEMSLTGVPVVVAGFTHYRGKGFTLDPNSWDEYLWMIRRVMDEPARYRLSEDQRRDAWNYAYRFFFEYTLPFPWHLLYFWDDVQEWPLARVLSEEGRLLFSDSFGYLAGKPLDWSTVR
jgi:hypothetical protein